ncbi:RNA polymerase recycling motor ATPase HelR [Antiquaquibacter soli]|uniref:RNA polymerase recycling motor ATPase HelR n=1 Tax=Antiquaquibacter soli TaxID=3064523 RepID=A0ABT9BLY0_9MICO|nr:RNA polymerase recycling motor ATPase HelR [Protaetiibacter sp. WY-16]MDO7880796.1 RNA polymerase recycling motor ATPase HelR [Protaetiibacter sp. WY-16]
MSAAASVFALPDRLSEKADPRLIAADERHFATIAATLDSSIRTASERLQRLLSAPGGWGQRALERDIEVHRVSARLRTLQRFGLDVCLGRIVSGSGTVYIGRIGLTDDSGESILVDWRSPAAEPFFGATHANPLGLSSRRRYRWTLGRITDYWDEVFTDEVAGHAALDDQSAFLASLGGARSSRMRDVLGTIQADQDAIIRAGAHGALVVDGGPGTGKTVVALHRTAYLLYSDQRLARGGVLFVGPNPGYLAYVSDVLPNLGEDGVQICTLRDLVAEGRSAGIEDDPRVRELAASGALVDAVETLVARREQPPTRGLVVETDWAEIEVTPDEWADAFDAADRSIPHNESREQVWDELLELLSSRSGVPADAIAEDDALRAAFDRAWPLLDPVALVAALRSDPALLRSIPGWSEADIRALQREDARAWTDVDLPVLDAARQRIGDPLAERRRAERRAARAAQDEGYQQVIDTLVAAADDGEDLISMFRPGDLKEVLIDETALPVSAPDELAGPFAHIVVDEAQELTDAEWGMLVRRCPSRSFTIVGDRAQSRRGFGESWQERLARVGVDRVTVSELTINYRTPAEVMAAAEPVIRAAVPDANVPTSVRSTGVAVRHGSPGELAGILDSWLATHADGVACVIGGQDAGPRPRVRSLTPELSKGLEFDLVVLVDPERWSAVDRYVAMTRATQELVILTTP